MRLEISVLDGTSQVSPLCERQPNPIGLQPRHPDKHIPGPTMYAPLSYFISKEQRDNLIDLIKINPAILKEIQSHVSNLGGNFRIYIEVKIDVLLNGKERMAEGKFLTYDKGSERHIEDDLTWVCFALDFAPNCWDAAEDMLTASLQTIFPLNSNHTMFTTVSLDTTVAKSIFGTVARSISDPVLLGAKHAHERAVMKIEVLCPPYTYKKNYQLSKGVLEAIPRYELRGESYEKTPFYSHNSAHNPFAYSANQQSSFSAIANWLTKSLPKVSVPTDVKTVGSVLDTNVSLPLEKAICEVEQLIPSRSDELRNRFYGVFQIKSLENLVDGNDISMEQILELAKEINETKDNATNLKEILNALKSEFKRDKIGTVSKADIEAIVSGLEEGLLKWKQEVSPIQFSVEGRMDVIIPVPKPDKRETKIKQLEALVEMTGASNGGAFKKFLTDYGTSEAISGFNRNIDLLYTRLTKYIGDLKSLVTRVDALKKSKEAQNKISELLVKDERLKKRSFSTPTDVLIKNQELLRGPQPLSPEQYLLVISSLLGILSTDVDFFTVNKIYDNSIDIQIKQIKNKFAKGMAKLYIKAIQFGIDSKCGFTMDRLKSTIGHYMEEGPEGKYRLNALFTDIPALKHAEFCKKLDEAIDFIHEIHAILANAENRSQFSDLFREAADPINEYRNVIRNFPYLFMMQGLREEGCIDDENLNVILKQIVSGLLDRLASEKEYSSADASKVGSYAPPMLSLLTNQGSSKTLCFLDDVWLVLNFLQQMLQKDQHPLKLLVAAAAKRARKENINAENLAQELVQRIIREAPAQALSCLAVKSTETPTPPMFGVFAKRC